MSEITDRIIQRAHALAHRKLLGVESVDAKQISEATIQALIVVAAIIETLTEEQQEAVWELVNNG